jgi:4-hydroxybenzoyl-CoA thioesterase/acyl-CoA thioester hydrolase
VPHEFKTQRKIEFVDTDMAGVVHFSRFFIFMETAEHEFLRSLGTSVAAKLEGMQLGWPRLAVSCEYLSPAKFEDVLDIHLTVARKGTKSMTYKFTLSKGDTLVARGQVTAACCICDAVKGFITIPIPGFLAEKIQEAPDSEDRG